MTVCDLNKNRSNILDIDYKTYEYIKKRSRKKRRSGISDFGALVDTVITTVASCSIAGGLGLTGAPYAVIFLISCAIIGGFLTYFFQNIGF